MSTTTMALMLLATGVAIVAGRAVYTALAAAHTRSRTAWELDRAEWRRWITRN